MLPFGTHFESVSPSGGLARPGRFLWLLSGVLLAGLFVFGTSDAAAQNVGRIAGSVTDASTGEPLTGANVVIIGTMSGSAVDLEGQYSILNVPPGEYELRASMIGYESVRVEGVVVNAGRTTTVDVRLPEEALSGEEVVVTAVRPDVELDKTATSHILRFGDVEALPGIRDISDVLNLTGDVVDGHFRGGRIGEELYMLQGMAIMNPLDNSAALSPIMSAVEEVEVITSGFGAQYGNAQSGVVRISMREGSRTEWDSRLEVRTRPPNRRHFGPSAFDPEANAYLRLLLLEGDIWLRGDPGADDPQPFYGTMASGLTSYFGGDTLAQLAMAQALYAQTRRDVGLNYGNEVDYSAELATGGPINDRMRMFMALRTRESWDFLPTERPNSEYQVMGNVVTDLWEGATLRVSGALAHDRNNVFPSANSVGGYQRWLWDRVAGTRQQRRTNTQLGARLTHMINPNTFYELQLNTLQANNQVGSVATPSFLPDTVSINWAVGTIAFPNNNSPDRINFLSGNDQFNDQQSRTLSFDGSITSQVTQAHQLNAGVQLNSYQIDVDNYLNLRSTRLREDYRARPFEGAVYVQDKMEFQGMIASIGLRLDLWYSGVDYFPDFYTPFGEPDSLGIFNPETATRERAPIHTRLQPRLGVSFPITASTVFHLNYGSFMQRPAFQYIVSQRLGHRLNDPVILGNPSLEPETTSSYDVGVVQALGNGFTLDVSGYYKDVNNLIQQANFIDDRAGYQVSSYFNLDYANIRGVRMALSRRTGSLTGSLNYQYSYATGKSPNATAATPIFVRDTTGVIRTDLTNVPTRDIVLDFDRQHNLTFTGAYTTGQNWGPEILNVRPLSRFTIATFTSARSGRPYTSPSDIRLVNTQRTPAEFNTDLRITRRFGNIGGSTGQIYLEVFNVFNNRTLNYNYLFQRPTATNPNLPLQYYEEHGIEDPQNGVRYWWDRGRQGPFAVDQSFLLYSNSPRSFNFGVVVDL